jgi:DNA-binding CsgD family transcriptional regulator
MRKQNLAEKLAHLTRREREVLNHVKSGCRVKSIALKMGLSRKTVDWHLSMIREKMGVDSTGELLLLFHTDIQIDPVGPGHMQ